MLTTELVRRGARRHADRIALYCGDQRMTFRDVDTTANRLAHVLAGRGVTPGTRVGLLVDNGPWSMPLDFA